MNSSRPNRIEDLERDHIDPPETQFSPTQRVIKWGHAFDEWKRSKGKKGCEGEFPEIPEHWETL